MKYPVAIFADQIEPGMRLERVRPSYREENTGGQFVVTQVRRIDDRLMAFLGIRDDGSPFISDNVPPTSVWFCYVDEAAAGQDREPAFVFSYCRIMGTGNNTTGKLDASSVSPAEFVLIEVMREMTRTDDHNEIPTAGDYLADIIRRLNVLL